MIAWLREHCAVNDPQATATVVLAALDGLIMHRLIDPALGHVDVAGPLLRMANRSDIDQGAR
ncbi:hypothetical protein [Nocardia gamkensis]|uniref:hypothetical protein n=1 Tax=Nocardia gamkensis TaxID=352869 RepID=UPI0037C93B04